MADGLDAFEMAEQDSLAALEEIVEQGLPVKERVARRRNPKGHWRQTNVKMDPNVKERVKALASRLGVPLEEVVHVALVRFLEDLGNGGELPRTREAAVRRTLL